MCPVLPGQCSDDQLESADLAKLVTSHSFTKVIRTEKGNRVNKLVKNKRTQGENNVSFKKTEFSQQTAHCNDLQTSAKADCVGIKSERVKLKEKVTNAKKIFEFLKTKNR